MGALLCPASDIPILVASLREATAIEATIRGLGLSNPVVFLLPRTDFDIPPKTDGAETVHCDFHRIGDPIGRMSTIHDFRANEKDIAFNPD